jgi:myosin heavy subunit
MTPELDYVILESEYNVIMALVNCYKKEYVMECYYMENNLNAAGSKIINGVSNAGQRIDQGFNNAIQKGNNAVNKLGQRIDNRTNNMQQHPVDSLSSKIQNGINKLLGWCKKASNFIVLNTKKIPPETPVQTPPQTQQLRQAAETYTQVNQRATQILSQPDNPQNEQQIRQITNELAEIEKKIKALQIKKTLLEKQQQELNQPQQLPPLKFNKPQQQQSAPQPTQQPTQQTQQPQQAQQQSQPVQQNGFVTIKAGDFQALIAQIQQQQSQTEKAINQSLQQANQTANNAQSAVSQAKQQLMNQAVKTEATILNDCVEITRDMKQQVNGNTSDAKPITGAQLAQIAVRLMKTSDVPNQYTYNPQTQTFNLVQDQNQMGEFICDSETALMYPIIMNTPTSIPNVYGVYKISNVRRIDDNTVIIPAQVIRPGFLADANTLRLFKPGVIKNPTQPQQQNGNIG